MGMQALGADLKSQGVIVAVVSPGTVETDMLSAVRDDYNMKTRVARYRPVPGKYKGCIPYVKGETFWAW